MLTVVGLRMGLVQWIEADRAEVVIVELVREDFLPIAIEWKDLTFAEEALVVVEGDLLACVGSEAELHCFDLLEGDLHGNLEAGVHFLEIEVDPHFDNPEVDVRFEIEVALPFDNPEADVPSEEMEGLHLDKPEADARLEEMEVGLHLDKPEADARLEEMEVVLHPDKFGVVYHFEIVEEGLAQVA
jgi:hypothetical protein